MNEDFKEKTESVLCWIAEQVKKFGVLIFVLYLGYLGIKKVWFWFTMPVLLLLSLRQIGILFSWTWVANISIAGITIMWVFIFSLLSYMFEKE